MSRLVAITGATGFLGLHLLRALAQRGAKLRILARRDPAHEFWSGLDFETIHGDLANPDALARLVHNADTVIHAAGLIRARNRAAFLRTNRDLTQALAQSTRTHAPSARFILVSTLAARTPHLSDYAASKRAGEYVTRTAYGGAETQLTIIRPPALYGPWDRATLPIFRAAAWPLIPVLSPGRLSLLHVTDAAEALARIAMEEGPAGLFALPGGDYTMEEIMTAAAQAQGRSGRLVHIPPFLLRAAGTAAGLLRKNSVFSAGKARELLHPDWVVQQNEALPADIHTPRIPLAKGLAETAAWYKTHGYL